jgi:hypothetical protein
MARLGNRGFGRPLHYWSVQMTQTTKTWTVLGLVLAILLLVLWLRKKNATAPAPTSTGVMTNTTVTVGSDVTQYPSRDESNNRLLRICTYDNGEQLSLDPNAVGGHCPPVYTDIAGKTGYLTKDEIITLPQAGTYSGTPGQGA